jgi:hypothetical protein
VFMGAIFTRHKSPTWAALNILHVPFNYVLLVFDDELAICGAATIGDLIKGVGDLFVGDVASVPGSRIARGQSQKLADMISHLPPEVTVEELRTHMKGLRTVTSAEVASVRLTTSVKPFTEVGSVDLNFRFTGSECDPFVKRMLGFYKQHVVSDAASAVELLNRALPGKVRDDRFAWGKH